jgi:hypothetical protein
MASLAERGENAALNQNLWFLVSTQDIFQAFLCEPRLAEKRFLSAARYFLLVLRKVLFVSAK